MEKEIRLYGPLAKFIGQRKFLAEISSAGEAIRMLLANFPGLERHMADQHYKVIVDRLRKRFRRNSLSRQSSHQDRPCPGRCWWWNGQDLGGCRASAVAISLRSWWWLSWLALDFWRSDWHGAAVHGSAVLQHPVIGSIGAALDSWWRFAAAFTNASAWSDWSGFSITRRQRTTTTKAPKWIPKSPTASAGFRTPAAKELPCLWSMAKLSWDRW
jgi:predicted phage tail protein